MARRPYRLTRKLSNGWTLKSAEHSQSLSRTRQSGFYNIDLASSRRFFWSSENSRIGIKLWNFQMNLSSTNGKYSQYSSLLEGFNQWKLSPGTFKSMPLRPPMLRGKLYSQKRALLYGQWVRNDQIERKSGLKWEELYRIGALWIHFFLN